MVPPGAPTRRALRVVPGGRADGVQAISDEQLIAAVERGDRRIADQIHDRLVGVVDGTLYRVLGRREADHDDLVQTAFEQIIMTITRGKYARACSLKAWAAAVATHVGLNALRARTRERKVLDRRTAYDGDQNAPAHAPDLESQVESRRELNRLRMQLASMDDAKAMTLLLHDAFGYELAEVATLTACSVAAAQSRLVRGRRELYDRLQVQGRGTREGGT